MIAIVGKRTYFPYGKTNGSH